MNTERDPLIQEALAGFRAAFGEEQSAGAAAPGRVNLIGEHTDYNDGFVLPVAVRMRVAALVRVRADGRVIAHSREFPEVGDFAVTDATRTGAWHDGVKGVLALLGKRGAPLPGLSLYVAGDVPAEAGLSSSAAFMLALAMAAHRLAGIDLTPVDAARAARSVEVEFFGVPCGILDQMASAACREGHALLIDCRTLDTRDIALPDSLSLLVGHTGVKRRLSDGRFEERVRQCTQAAAFLAEAGEPVAALRDVDPAMLARHAEQMPPTLLKRARHVVAENRRVHEAVEALAVGDLRRLGNLVNASHASLRYDYEVSCPELDAMTAAMTASPEVAGARLVGAGFGGCAIAFVMGAIRPALIEAIAEDYRARTGREGRFYSVRPGPGAFIISSQLAVGSRQ